MGRFHFPHRSERPEQQAIHWVYLSRARFSVQSGLPFAEGQVALALNVRQRARGLKLNELKFGLRGLRLSHCRLGYLSASEGARKEPRQKGVEPGSNSGWMVKIFRLVVCKALLA